MKFFLVLLFSLAFDGTKSEDVLVPTEAPTTTDSLSPAFPASTDHFFVIKTLNSVFGEANCELTTDVEYFGGNGEDRYYCLIELPGFSAYADYISREEDNSMVRPIYLEVSYGYTCGSSGLEYIYFEECGLECVDGYLTYIAGVNDGSIDLPDVGSSGPAVASSSGPAVASSSGPVAMTSNSPTIGPSNSPTIAPSNSPTIAPSNSPTIASSNSPTIAPSNSPTIAPSNSLTIAPSNSPTIAPSNSPTIAPSNSPTTGSKRMKKARGMKTGKGMKTAKRI